MQVAKCFRIEKIEELQSILRCWIRVCENLFEERRGMTSFIDMSPIIFVKLRQAYSVLMAVFIPMLMSAAEDGLSGVSRTLEIRKFGFEEVELGSENRSSWNSRRTFILTELMSMDVP